MLRFDFSASDVALSPGEAVSTKLTLTTPLRWGLADAGHAFVVRAASAPRGDMSVTRLPAPPIAPVTIEGWVVQRSLIPWWLLLMIFTLVAALVGTLWSNARQ